MTTLCKASDKKREKNAKKAAERAAEGKSVYQCEKCQRMSHDKDHLCKPVKIKPDKPMKVKPEKLEKVKPEKIKSEKPAKKHHKDESAETAPATETEFAADTPEMESITADAPPAEKPKH